MCKADIIHDMYQKRITDTICEYLRIVKGIDVISPLSILNCNNFISKHGELRRVSGRYCNDYFLDSTLILTIHDDGYIQYGAWMQ